MHVLKAAGCEKIFVERGEPGDRRVVLRAREFAQQDADGQAGGGLTAMVRMANR
jgi:hypothetical protein